MAKERICHRCGRADTYKDSSGKESWYNEYDDKECWTGYHICYSCNKEIKMSNTKKITEERMKERKCYVCGVGETSKWHVHYNGYIKIYYCHKCELEDRRSATKRIKDQRMKGRICRVCGVGKIYAFGMCQKCYMEDYHKRPDSGHNIIKSIAQSRSKIFDIDRFNEFSSNLKGYMGECVVAKVLGLKNQNDLSDNYNSKYDLTIHPIYGVIQVKTKGLNIKTYLWEYNLKKEYEFDYIFLLCMDGCEPWKNVDKVCAIPGNHNDIYGLLKLTIIKDSVKGSKWEKFEIDKTPYNDAWHSLFLYLKNKKLFSYQDIRDWLDLR